VNQEAWPTPAGGSSREPLPRVEDLPVAEQGYEQESVRAAFDSFYRHAAQLDTALRTLEAVDSFHRQAAALRADLRGLRTAGWTQQPWSATPAYGAGLRAPREGVSPAVWRIVGEVVFLIAVSVLLGVAKLQWWVIVAVMAIAFLIILVVEWAASRDRWQSTRAAAGTDHAVVEAEPAVEPTEEGEALGWTAFEEAQEPSDAMTMIGTSPEVAAAGESEPVVEAPAEAERVEAAEPLVADEAVPEEAEPGVGESSPSAAHGQEPRHWWQRRGGDAEQPAAEVELPPSDAPRHVRVLPPEEHEEEPAAQVDPWEQGFDDATYAEPEALAGEPDEETGENTSAVASESEQPPERRRFRRR
jgi:hypothetical protein